MLSKHVVLAISRPQVLLALLLALILVVSFARHALAAEISDFDGAEHSYGGYTCLFGGGSVLADGGGSSGDSSSVIVTEACRNGYRELWTRGITTTNGYYYHYSDWVLYDVAWTFSNRTDLCQVAGLHRMSKSGIDVSAYVGTEVIGCQPA